MAEAKKWIKLDAGIFEDDKIFIIESEFGEEADSIILIWLKLLCMAGKSNNDGIFMITDKVPYTESMLASVFRRDIDTVHTALEAFVKYGMIEIIEDVITIPHWGDHQVSSGKYDSRTEYMREYMRKRRAKEKQESVVEEQPIEEEKPKVRTVEKSFNVEKAWEDTFALYPKKYNSATAKQRYMDMLVSCVDGNRKELAKEIYAATKLYVDQYKKEHPGDDSGKYLPKFEVFLKEDCLYFMDEARKANKDG